MLTGHGFNKIPTWAKTLLAGDVSGGTSPKLSDGDVLQAVNGNSYFNPRFQSTDSYGQLHADKILHITTNYREKIIIGGFRNSGNTLPPVWQGNNSTYQQVQINGVNFRGNISFGAGINSSTPVIGIGSPYTQLRWDNLFITPTDSTYSSSSFRTVSKFSFLDVYGDEMMSIRNLSSNKILELDTSNPSNETSSGLNRTGILKLNQRYWSKALSDGTGIDTLRSFEISMNRYTDNSTDYLGYVSFKYNGNECFRIKENGVFNASNYPTTSAGLVSGDVWNNGGVLTIV